MTSVASGGRYTICGGAKGLADLLHYFLQQPLSLRVLQLA